MLFVRLIRFLTLLAVLTAPAAMAGVAPAAAHHAAAAEAGGHCAGMDEPSAPAKDRSAQLHDCLMACAAIPALGSAIEAAAVAPAAAQPVRPATLGHGLEPEAETPPPRNA